MTKVSIQIVTYNSLKFLGENLRSIFSQTFKDFSVLVIDNGSRDGTAKYLRENFPQVKLILNSKNLGFSFAHNQGIKFTRTPYILVANPDIILEKDFLAELVRMIESKKEIGMVSGKFLKVKFGDQEIKELIKTNILDTTGLKIFKSRRIINRGEGEKDLGQYNKIEEVFGFSGTCVLYRREAIEDVKIPVVSRRGLKFRKEYFDEDFFAYKEDIDLAWRFRLRGWKAIYVPQAVGYHFRTLSGKSELKLADLKKRKIPSFLSFLSYRNHLWTLLKNDFLENFLLHFPFIFFHQLAKEIYLFLTQPFTLIKGSFSFWRGFKKMYKKRRYLLQRAKVKPKEIRKWFE